jgi:hypothetical protein
MPFIDGAATLARTIMNKKSPEMADCFALLIDFLSVYPDAASSTRGRSRFETGSREYIEMAADAFLQGRQPRGPMRPATIPDGMVKVIMHNYFGVPSTELEKAEEWHTLAMGAENLVGDLLERYIASRLEPQGWVWCAGSMIRAVDFVYRRDDGTWYLLQVKNRDNSENSSSSAIRSGTDIQKWFRTFSKKSETNWNRFPVENARSHLNEDGFRAFVIDYLAALRSK